MNNLIKELSTPRHTKDGTLVGPTNLDRRAANAIKQLMLVNITNDLVVKTLTKQNQEMLSELEEYHNDKNTTTSDIISIDETNAVTDSTQLTLFD
jgi:predicted alpha/beta-fold hydrolase